jgi:hypothetical protein
MNSKETVQSQGTETWQVLLAFSAEFLFHLPFSFSEGLHFLTPEVGT